MALWPQLGADTPWLLRIVATERRRGHAGTRPFEVASERRGDVLRQQVPESANDLALTVVIPAFNEAERLPNSLRRLLEVVREGTSTT